MLCNKLSARNLFGQVEDYPIFPISVYDFLAQLVMTDDPARKQNILGIQHFFDRAETLKKCYIRLVQFTKTYSALTPEFFHGRFCRSNGIMSPPGAKGVDGFLPVLIADKVLESYEDMRNVELKSFSHFGLQFKNLADPPGPEKYMAWATEKMHADEVLGPAAHSRDRTLPYVSLVLDVGEEAAPRIWFFPSSDPRQTSVAIRGLRPSNILGLFGDKAKEIDTEFFRFISPPNDPCRDPAFHLPHSQGDVYSTPVDKYLEENSLGLVARCAAAIASWESVEQTALKSVQRSAASVISECRGHYEHFNMSRDDGSFGRRSFEQFYKSVVKLEDYTEEAKSYKVPQRKKVKRDGFRA
jgi:hypothetical protein